MRKKIRAKIKAQGTITDFAKNHNLRQASVSDFLNDKQDIGVRTLEKILKGAGLEVGDSFEKESMSSLPSIKLGSNQISIGDTVRVYKSVIYKSATGPTHKVSNCFGNAKVKVLILNDVKTDKLELLIL